MSTKLDSDTAGPGRPRAFNPEEALDSAMRVFWRKGYLGTSLTDLTEAMGINRPSLYATFGNKEALFGMAIERYFRGPAAYLNDALAEPTAKSVVESIFRGVVNLLSDPHTPPTCLWVHGALSCGDESADLTEEFAAHRIQGHAKLRARLKRAADEGDLPAKTDVDALARFVQAVNFGLTVLSSTGATRKHLLGVVACAMQAWPK